MKTELHSRICTELTSLYERKNHDYGDSFGKSFAEYGMAMPCIRLEDKLNRLKALTRNGDQQVSDESIDDTLMDLANYAIMTIVERRIAEESKPNGEVCDMSQPHCPTCKYRDLYVSEQPCNECRYGNGSNKYVSKWEAETK